MKIKTILLLFVIYSLGLKSQSLDLSNGLSFQPGEELNYKIKYSIFPAAEATLRVEEADKKISNKNGLHLIASGKTTSGLRLLSKVNNRYDSYIDTQTMLPDVYTENIREDNYRRDGYVLFDRSDNKAINNKKDTFNVSEKILDVISTFYYSRCLDINKLRKGDTYHLDYFLEGKSYPMDIKYLGLERIETDLGIFECHKFSPSLQPGRIFRKDSKMYLWITNDANRIPLKVQVEILVGSLYLELKSYKGLKYNLTSRR